MTATIVCPHCGFESEDDDLCRACGQPIEGKIPTRKVSLTYLLSNNLFSWMKNSEFQGFDKNELLNIDASDDPGLAHLPGNSYHYIWLTSHDKD